MDMNLSKLQERVKDRRAWQAAVHEVIKSWTRLSNCTTATKEHHSCIHREAGPVAANGGRRPCARKGGPSALIGLHADAGTVGFLPTAAPQPLVLSRRACCSPQRVKDPVYMFVFQVFLPNETQLASGS